MIIDNFELDYWLNTRELKAKYNLSSSCCKPVTVNELLQITGYSREKFFDELGKSSIDYGDPLGSPRLKEAIAGLYSDIITSDMVVCTHGGTGANSIIYQALIEKGDNIVCILPNYQLNYSLPKALGAEVRCFTIDSESQYSIDFDIIDKLVDNKTKFITLANPNNPTGYSLKKEELDRLIEIARKKDTYVVCDEIYRGLDDAYMQSICDLYEKGICTSSVSKVFSIPGTRVGWIITRDLSVKEKFMNFRSYNSLCEGPINEWIAAIVLENKDVFYKRNKKIVDEGKNILIEWIKKQPHFKIACDSMSATSFIYYDFEIPADEFANDLYEDTGVLICHGGCFEQERSFRIGYGLGETEKLKQSLDIIDEYVKKLEIEGRIFRHE